MRFRSMVFAVVLVLYSTGFAVSSEELRTSFEWGEYQRLIDVLEPFFATAHPELDSTEYARYHCYLGVAYFGTGRVGDARREFLSALSFDREVRPGKIYISEEIDNLFTATHAEYIESEKRLRLNDSLRVVQQQAFEANLTALKKQELKKSRRTGALLAVSCFVAGTALAAVAGYRYYATKEPYIDFQNAALQGDKSTYDRLRPTIRRANGIIVSCAIAAALSETGGIVFTLRTRRMHRGE